MINASHAFHSPLCDYDLGHSGKTDVLSKIKKRKGEGKGRRHPTFLLILEASMWVVAETLNGAERATAP